MMSKITKFKKKTKGPSIVGVDVAGSSIFMQGRKIPKMRCIERDTCVEIILDDRFGYSFDKDVVWDAVNFAAQAMAIGMGYSDITAKTKDMPFAPEVVSL